MKQTLSVLIPLLLIMALVLNQALPADAAKKEKKVKGIAQEVLAEITQKTDELTKKIYERELYSPEDSRQLISLKIQLDEQMDIMPEASFAPLYFKIGNIYRLRGQEADAINCYQTVLENFSDTVYGPKSRDILTQMGVEIAMPEDSSKDEDEGLDEEI